MRFLSKSLIVFSFLLVSCSGLQPTTKPSPTLSPRVINSTCVDKVDQAFDSHTPIAGAFDCFSPGWQSVFANYFGVIDDQSFADWISTYPPNTSQACGAAVVYDATHNDKEFLSSDGVLVRYYFKQSDGRVDSLQTAGTSSSSTVVTKSIPTCTTPVSWPKPKFDE